MPFNWLTNPLCSGHSPLPLLLALTVPLKTHCTHSLIARRIINYTVEIDAKSKSPFKRIWWYATHKLWYHHGASKINIRQQTGKCTYVLVCTCMHICYHSKANTQICTNRQLAIWNRHCSAVCLLSLQWGSHSVVPATGLTFSHAKRTGAVAKPSFKSAAVGLPICSVDETKSSISSTSWKAKPMFRPYWNATSATLSSAWAMTAV